MTGKQPGMKLLSISSIENQHEVGSVLFYSQLWALLTKLSRHFPEFMCENGSRVPEKPVVGLFVAEGSSVLYD